MPKLMLGIETKAWIWHNEKSYSSLIIVWVFMSNKKKGKQNV